MKSDMENKDWGDEEMSLKRFTRNNPFTVPSAYFEGAEQRILSLVKLDELKSTGPAIGFTVPANYFDVLSASINSRINIGVGANAEETGFALPANYFNELTANINSRINIEVDAGAENRGFALPSGYFDELSANITSRINIETEAEDAGFALPAGYFDELSANITSRINIEIAAEEEAFAMPAGYFDELTSKIQSRVAIEEVAGGEDFFTVPDGYFENMQQQITARIAVEEILEEKEAGFAVPDGYFEALNRDILKKTGNKEDVIRKTIVRKLFASNSFKYATAACLALIVGAGAILIQNGSQVVVPGQPAAHQHTLLHSELANVPVDEIRDYLELNVDAGDATGLIQDDKQINTKALAEDLSDYIDVN